MDGVDFVLWAFYTVLVFSGGFVTGTVVSAWTVAQADQKDSL